MKFVELGRHLSAGQLKSAYFVTGDDPFIVHSAIKLFTSLVGQMRELNYIEYSVGASASQIIASLGTPPMLADYRITRVDGYVGELGWLKNYLDNPVDSSVLIFTGNITPNFTSLIPRIEIVDCNRLDGAYLTTWIQKKTISFGHSIESAAASLLAEYCNRDMSRITGELNKLVDYAGEQTIVVDDVKKMVSPDIEVKVFALGEEIATKNANKAIVILEALLGENNSPTMLLGILFNHFRRLLFVSMNPNSDTLASDLKVKSEYAVKMALKQAKSFSPRRLKAIFDKLCVLDADVKAGKILDRNALISFVCETILVA